MCTPQPRHVGVRLGCRSSGRHPLAPHFPPGANHLHLTVRMKGPMICRAQPVRCERSPVGILRGFAPAPCITASLFASIRAAGPANVWPTFRPQPR
ncbi:MAG: hypothetical protein CM15mP128_2780 [Methanobacteriota archaeon]|nr:MAG: hypothetical protein CM15mP128_2780 [Euryarchaeota archaeon]